MDFIQNREYDYGKKVPGKKATGLKTYEQPIFRRKELPEGYDALPEELHDQPALKGRKTMKGVAIPIIKDESESDLSSSDDEGATIAVDADGDTSMDYGYGTRSRVTIVKKKKPAVHLTWKRSAGEDSDPDIWAPGWNMPLERVGRKPVYDEDEESKAGKAKGGKMKAAKAKEEKPKAAKAKEDKPKSTKSKAEKPKAIQVKGAKKSAKKEDIPPEYPSDSDSEGKEAKRAPQKSYQRTVPKVTHEERLKRTKIHSRSVQFPDEKGPGASKPAKPRGHGAYGRR